jgi:hypothetical protein
MVFWTPQCPPNPAWRTVFHMLISICNYFLIFRFLDRKRRATRLQFYKTIAVPILIYGSETWALSKSEESKIQSWEKLFLRSVKGCSRMDRIKTDGIRQEVNIFTLEDKIKDNKVRRCQHLNRMKSKGFWLWCVIICKSVFLDFVHRLYFNKITTFRKLDLLPSSSKEEGQKP